MYNKLLNKEAKLSVIGLGYVGLPLALAFAKKIPVIGFDINAERIDKMKNRIDPSKELSASAFENCDIEFTTSPDVLKEAQFHVVAVPTPIDEHKQPDLTPLLLNISRSFEQKLNRSPSGVAPVRHRQTRHR